MITPFDLLEEGPLLRKCGDEQVRHVGEIREWEQPDIDKFREGQMGWVAKDRDRLPLCQVVVDFSCSDVIVYSWEQLVSSEFCDWGLRSLQIEGRSGWVWIRGRIDNGRAMTDSTVRLTMAVLKVGKVGVEFNVRNVEVDPPKNT